MEWKLIEEWNGEDGALFDLWLDVPATPLSMGIADAWRVINCWHQDGKWFDKFGESGVLEPRYITHWMPTPNSPTNRHLPQQPGNENTLGKPEHS